MISFQAAADSEGLVVVIVHSYKRGSPSHGSLDLCRTSVFEFVNHVIATYACTRIPALNLRDPFPGQIQMKIWSLDI